MLRYASLVLVLATHVLDAQQQAVRPAPAAAERTIRGRVTAASNGAALPRVRIAVVSAQGQSMRAVLSDDSGRFALVVPAATRTMTASKAGYAAVAMAAPQDVEDVEVRLEPGSAVSGRVTDPQGAPVPLAPVTVRRALPGRDTGAVAAAFETTTDDLGEYRVGGLAAGRYTVTVARPRPAAAAPGAGPAPANVSQTTDLRAGEEAAVSLVIALPTATGNPFDEFLTATQAALADLRSGNRNAFPNGRLMPTGDATLRGRVLADQGEPLAGATVTVLRAGLQLRATTTDASGEYAVIGLPPGEVIVEAAKGGYVTAQHGQGRISRLGSPVTLGARAAAANVDVILARGSVVTGIVMDEDGEVMAGADVEALQLQTSDGRLVAQRAGVMRRTDDYGRYRIFGLMPGRYLIRAAIDEVMTGEDGRPIAEGYAPVYYPAAIRADDGSAVTVEAGRDVAGLNLVFTRAAVARVRGRVVDAAGRPLSAAVVLAVSHRSGGMALGVREASTATNGSFEIANVPPGEYVVQALAGAASDDDDRPGARAAGLPEFGREMVSVRDAEPALVIIQTSPPASIAGRVVLEGRPGNYAARMEVRAVPADRDDSPVNGGPRVAVVRSDRTFVLDGVTGRVRLLLGHDADAWYVRSVVVGGRDVTRQPFDAGLQGAAFSNATIVVSPAGAEISGQVVDDQDQRVEDAAVIVFSTGRDGWYGGSERVRFTRPDRSGVFRLAGLPPGSYWVAAVDTLEGSAEAGDWTSGALLQQLAAVGRRVTVGEGAIHTGRFRIARR